MKAVTLYINNTVIRGFCDSIVRVKRIVFTDCVINISEYSPARNWYLRCGDIQFNNCTFVCKLLDDRNFIHLLNDDKIKIYNIRFINCEFDMDRDWRGSEITWYKNFIFVEDQQGRFVQIDFTLCIGGYDIGTSVKLIKMSNKEVNSENIIIQSSNSGIEIQSVWISNNDALHEETNWTIAVRNDGYNPTPTPNPDSTPVPTPDNRDTFDKIDTWKIMTFTFVGVSVVFIIVTVTTCILSKRVKYDRSD